MMARISVYLLIFLGIINLANFIFPNMKFKLGIPSFSKKYLKRWEKVENFESGKN